MICVNDEHPANTPIQIDFTEEGIEICSNNSQQEKEQFLIEINEEGIEIYVNDDNPTKVPFSSLFVWMNCFNAFIFTYFVLTYLSFMI